MNPTTFKLGTEFPTEGFVQSALEAHFDRLGYQRFKQGFVDYAGRHPETGESWLVEAKGETSDVGLDFRTGLGQVLQAIAEPSVRYGVAAPKTARFLAQCHKVSDRVRVALGLHWLLVDSTGIVTVVRPEETLPGLGA